MKCWNEQLKRLAAPVWLTLSILVLFASTLLAQETTGGLQGTIKDPSGAVVAKAKVSLASSALIGNKDVVTDASGYYRFSNLPPGNYTITAVAKGFKTAKRDGLKVEVGHQPSVEIVLEVGAESATVEVTADAPIIDVTSTQNLTNVNSEALQNLPTGTSFQSVIQFAPMARNEPLAGVGTSTGVNGTGGSMPGSSSSGRSVGYSIGGAADSESSYLIEGQDTENISGGFSSADVPMEFIQEVQVKTSGVSAEYGGALGGVINVIMKKGSNELHGGLFSTYEGNSVDANQWQTDLRYDPTDSGNKKAGLDPVFQHYQRKADTYTIFRPGATLGGALLKDKLWFFAGFAPTLNSRGRTVDFSASDPTVGVVNLTQQNQTYFGSARLDYAMTQKVRLFASWLYQYAREEGSSLPLADPVSSQSTFVNPYASNPLDSYSHNYGWSAPNSTLNFGGDITLTQNLVSTTRFGYFFQNYHDFGWPTSGADLFWQANGVTTDFNGVNQLPTALQYNAGHSSSAYDGTNTLYNANKHIQFNQDFSWYKSGLWGTHNLKGGYQLNHLSNVINQNGNVPYVILYPGQNSYSPYTSTGIANCTTLGNEYFTTAVVDGKSVNTPYCTGLYGYAEVQDFSTILTTPAVDWNHALYVQDSWTVGHGVTLDLGLRMEKESLPAPDGETVQAINFNWSDKIEPRLGAAWDPTQKGKMKISGSFGVVNDVMKLLLAQSSWGAQAYEDCVYPLGPDGNNTFLSSDVNTVFKNGRACPSGATNLGANFNNAQNTPPTAFLDSQTNVSLIENMAWRAWEPVAPGVKPYRQHEYVFGFDYEVKPGYSLSVHYNRRRLDHILEDAALSDVNWAEEMYSIVNPGEGVNSNPTNYAKYLTSLGSGFGVPGVSFDLADWGTCTSCPANPKAIRNYDGMEVRLAMTPSAHWNASISYTYSSLWGNYTGLTTTDQSDGGSSGRNSPDTTRSFDESFYYFKADGGSSNGPLPTDRPNVFKGNLYYEHPWSTRHTTTIGLFQNFMQGSPVSSFMDLAAANGANPLESTYLYGRGKWVDVAATSMANGGISIGSPYEKRTPWFIQSDFNFAHEIKTGDHKSIRFVFTATNALNQHSVTAYWAGINSDYFATPLDPVAAATGQGVTLSSGAALYQTLEEGYSVPNALANSSVVKNSQYGQPSMFQTPRSTRFEVHYNF